MADLGENDDREWIHTYTTSDVNDCAGAEITPGILVDVKVSLPSVEPGHGLVEQHLLGSGHHLCSSTRDDFLIVGSHG